MEKHSRRTFIKRTGLALAASTAGVPFSNARNSTMPKSPIQIVSCNSGFERQPLRRPFGFKGSAMTNVWQTAVRLDPAAGRHRIGLGTQNVLWSDSRVFERHSESGGNALMYAMTERAMQMVKGQSFLDPLSLLDDLQDEVLEYGRRVTGQADLRTTFALNALVPIDNAAWLLFADQHGFKNFDEMIPAAYRQGLSAQHDRVASIPALGYGTPVEEIKALADAGFFIMKIKIGAPGSQAEMLEKDKAFLQAIHSTIGHYETPQLNGAKIPYYFDANGRYEHQDTLHRFLDFAEEIGALGQIAVLEEPFGERNQEPVHELAARGPRVAADESAHTDADTISRIEQGYNAIALKAIAKTLSMTLRMAQAAYERNVPCFCADLTVNPILVDWNKNVAARLPAFPGLDLGLQETNGWQNYRQWESMKEHHPLPEAPWIPSREGVYHTGEAFFRQSGGIFDTSSHYEALLHTKE